MYFLNNFSFLNKNNKKKETAAKEKKCKAYTKQSSNETFPYFNQIRKKNMHINIKVATKTKFKSVMKDSLWNQKKFTCEMSPALAFYSFRRIHDQIINRENREAEY